MPTHSQGYGYDVSPRVEKYENRGMASAHEKPADNPLLAKIDELRLQLRGQPTRNAIGAKAGLSRHTLRQLELRGPNASLSLPSIAALAKTLKVDASVLMAVAPRGPHVDGTPSDSAAASDTIPILGTAAGAIVGALALGEPIDRVERPPALAHVPNAYAVYVAGQSMQPMHCEGDLRFAHPHRPPRTGDSVIVQTRGEAGDVLGWIKIYDHKNGEWLICKQLHPAGEYKFKRDAVIAMHRVLTTAEMFNK